jgi:hypothetical protein
VEINDHLLNVLFENLHTTCDDEDASWGIGIDGTPNIIDEAYYLIILLIVLWCLQIEAWIALSGKETTR